MWNDKTPLKVVKQIILHCWKRDFHSVFLFLKSSRLFKIPLDKLVLVEQTIFAIGQLRQVVITIEKPLAIHANAFESIEEIRNDIKNTTSVSVENRRFSLDRVIVKGTVAGNSLIILRF